MRIPGLVGVLFFAIFLGFLPFQTQAASSCQPVQIITGGLASSYTVCNGSLSVSMPPSGQVNSNISVTLTINNSQNDSNIASLISGGKTFYLVVCPASAQINDCLLNGAGQQITQQHSSAGAATITFSSPVGGPLTTPGQYNILAYAESDFTIDTGTGTSNGQVFVTGTANFQSLAGTTNGITIAQTSQSAPANSGFVDNTYTYTYSDGGSGKTITGATIDCDSPNNLAPATGSISSGSKTGQFDCKYNSTAGTHNILIKVTLSDGSTISTSPSPFVVTITGNESSQGAQNVSSNPNPISTLASFIAETISIIIGWIQQEVYSIFSFLVVPVVQAMLSIHPYTDAFVQVIYFGWVIVRNLTNIFFILALIIIAMATLLRVESYQYRHLLVQLIIAALLVNFSLVIGQAVLGLADVVQAQFLPANSAVINSLAATLMLGWRQIVTNPNLDFSGGVANAFALVTTNFIWLGLSVGSFFVFLALAAFLLIRIVALWLLLLVSPIAYACGVLPSTAHYRSQWWQMFLKYAFFTPIMAFFLNMAANIAQTYTQINPLLSGISAPTLAASLGASNGSAGSAAIAAFVFSFASNILLLVFLIAALKVADLAGVYGAKSITEWAQKGIFRPYVVAGAGAQVVGNWSKKQYDKRTAGLASGNWFSRQAFKALHPVATVGAIRAESKEERELYKERVGAAATKVARKQFGWRRMTEDPTYLFDEHKGKELYEKEEGPWSPNEQINVGKINRLAEEAKNGDLRAAIKLKFALAEAFRHRNLNEVLEGENGMANRKLGGPLNYNSDNIRYFFQQMAKEGYLDEDFVREFLKDIGRDAYETGDFNGAELVYSDPETGHAHLIEMAPRGADGNSLPVGWNDYVTKRTAFIEQADREGKVNAATKGRANAVAKYGAGATAAQINEEVEKIQGVEIASRLKSLEDAEAGKNHGHNPYANSMHAERGRNYMKINLSKKKGGQVMDMFHDSLINVGVEDGEVTLSDAGTQALGKIDEQSIYSLMRDNMAPKTKEKFKLYTKEIVTNERKSLDRIKAQLTKVVTDENREKGVYMTQPEIDQQVESRTNLWLAASAGLASGKQAQSVMDIYKIQTNAAGVRETLAQRDARVKAEFIQMMKDSAK